MEGMEHFYHDHPLILSNDHSPPDAPCSACRDPILSNTDFYHCINQSVASQDSPCTRFLLHKTCAHLPMIMHHPLHAEHVLTLYDKPTPIGCKPCDKPVAKWFYVCNEGCMFIACIKCAFLERELNHPSHSHALTLLPLKATLHGCTACGTEGIKDFSYLCKTCLFWIHQSCASAPTSLIREDHDSDHPLVLAYSLPSEYRSFGVSCYLCRAGVKYRDWLYYCAGCRYFAHVQCALSAAESGKNDDEGDVEGSNLVRFPISDDKPYLLYQLIQQFAKKFSEKSGKADIISQCRSGHSLILFDDINSTSVGETNTSTDHKRICDGCVQPLSSPPGPFYGCLDCNFFLHTLCAAELPREIHHASRPENELTPLTRCYQTSKPFNFYICGVCGKYCNGISYSDESNGYWVDIVCAALPGKIKHDSHKHALHHLSVEGRWRCRGCTLYINSGRSFGCKICDYYIHTKCALKRGTLKHRWDEHHLSLMYPPVKAHPHAFNCEFCSEDINPNCWFYHCRKCDTSFHCLCVDQDEFSNVKYGGILKDDNLHEHGIELCDTRHKFHCAKCGTAFNIWDPFKPCFYSRKPLLKCVSCKFFVCMTCIITHYGSLQPRARWMHSVDIDRYVDMDRFRKLFLL